MWADFFTHLLIHTHKLMLACLNTNKIYYYYHFFIFFINIQCLHLTLLSQLAMLLSKYMYILYKFYNKIIYEKL